MMILLQHFKIWSMYLWILNKQLSKQVFGKINIHIANENAHITFCDYEFMLCTCKTKDYNLNQIEGMSCLCFWMKGDKSLIKMVT